ncbi:Crp/Fnr family transcriptional regulator [Croceibacterium sp. LX-88]|jgi:CRP/FNR family transcriptional regulator|uniref:Crp/Fnr family transcriptional regulator n=1 Tax=Croceibacterium selenioxidans TaxID=2838833 RepID=A0ABS5W059_9SPHN|nr:Crp/Fnr family transcriptional regulator [Croceibacterium selenioxidans]MBT2133158.1 Crp/Fnr family transcriptional regulator [Croceibacterium selenioxidans]
MGLNCSTCPVRDRAACSVLTDGEREALARSGRSRKLRRGEVLFAAGDENTACATLLKGALKVTSVDEQGTERILAIVHPSGFIGELFAPFAHHDVVALTDSELCVFPRSEMGRAIDLNPRLSQALLRRSQEDLLQSRELLALSGRRSAPSKVAGLVMGIAEGASDSSCHAAREFELPLTRGEIAGMLGLTIETVSRALTKFERDGVIRRRGARGIELLDPAQLGWVAEGAEL